MLNTIYLLQLMMHRVGAGTDPFAGTGTGTANTYFYFF
jgi:hypothetical protein